MTRHTFRQYQKQGYEAQPCDLQVSFGKGDKVCTLLYAPYESSSWYNIIRQIHHEVRTLTAQFWTNLFPTQLVARHQKDIRRFNTAIKWMRRLEVVFALIPIKYTLKMWGLSNEFIDSMILPSLALFLGTGNATPNLPTVMMERLYTSPTYGMWYKVDEHSLSSNLPPMVVFPESTKFYTAWKEDMEKKGVKVGSMSFHASARRVC